MKALQYQGPTQFAVEHLAQPTPNDHQVLIKVKACGVCRTDVHIHHGEFISEFPLIPGHEFVGEIVRVGADVTAFSVGDRVAADNTVLCGHCYYCRRNQPLYCENFYSLGCNGPGGFAEYVVVNAEKVFSIGDLPFDEAVMIEPTACAVHGLDKIQVKPGDDILLFGAGATGIVLAQLLKSAGAGRVVVVASSARKLAVLENLGIDATVLMERANYTKHEHALRELAPQGFDIVIDATGAAEVIGQLTRFTKRGAKVVIYGVSSLADRVSFSPYEIFHKELQIIGSFAQTHCFDRAIQFLQNGTVQVSDIITHRFKLEEFEAAISQVESGRDHIKVIINVD